MADPQAPAAPRVRAPQRLDGDGPREVAPAGLEAVPAGTAPFASGGGAEVTAVVGGAPTGPGIPTTATPATAPVPVPGLARTGGDTALLLTFALVALLLGALLVRLGKPRPAPSSRQGAP